MDEDNRSIKSKAHSPMDNMLDLSFGQESQPGAEMSKIDDACKRAVSGVDGGLAMGVVDLQTGVILGSYNNVGFSQELNEIVAALEPRPFVTTLFVPQAAARQGPRRPDAKGQNKSL